MKSYQQLSAMSNGELSPQEAKQLFDLYCENTGQDEDEADAMLFAIPPQAAVALLKIQKDESE